MGNLMLAISKPTGLWESIIYWIEGGVLNYGLTVILFTLMLKVILSPLDFFIKYTSKRSSLIQKKVSPQVAKLQKKYANNQAAIQAQLNALYKKEGLNMVTSCLVMFINLALTLVIFFTMFSSLRKISAYKIISQYEDLEATYIMYNTQEEKEAAVIARYAEIKDSFLWINNIWRPDTWATQIPTYAELKSAVRSSSKEYKQYVEEINEEQYEKVMSPIREENKGWNGYLILAVLAGVMAYISQIIIEKSNDIKGVKDPQLKTNQSLGILKLLLPAINVIFILTSNAAFGLYLLTSTVTTTILSLIINVLVKKSTRKLEEETKQVLLKQEQKMLKG